MIPALALLGACAAVSCADSKPVELIRTSSDRAFDLTRTTNAAEAGRSGNIVAIDTCVRYQTIDGFGAAITGATAYNLMQMTPENRAAFLRETFSPTDGFGMNYVRVCIGCSDFSLSDYTCCDTPGIENFALTAEETDYVIPVLKEILAINPSLKIMASPWTAPRWMKVNDPVERKPFESWTSGHLNPDCYADYAEYFVKWLKAFKDQGIDIYSITLQNEPLNRGNSASMFMGWDEQRDFIKTAVGPAFRREGIDTKIYAFDHNYNYDNMPDQQGYPMRIYEDPEASQYIAGAAYHNYGGRVDELDRVHDAYPDKELVFSESTAGFWNDGRNLEARLIPDMREIALGTVNRNSRGAIIWNLMLDANRGPNRPGGCTTGFGAVDIDSTYTNITRNSFYYIMAHMSGVVDSEAVRVASSGYSPQGLTYSAFVNPDGSHAFVACNGQDSELSFDVADGTTTFPLTLPAGTIISARW